MRVIDMVSFWARTTPSHPAVIQPEGIVSYAALDDAIEAAAGSFAANILDRSSPVALSVDTALKMLVAGLGLMRAGFSIVPASPGLYEHLPRTGAKTLVHDRRGETVPGLASLLFDDGWLTGGSRGAARPRPVRRPAAAAPSMIYFTSGTTGRPKPIVLTQAAWEQRILVSNNAIFANYERVLIVPGLASAYGFNRACEALHIGKTACFAPPGQPTLWLVNTYEIDSMIASIQQALSLADIQENVTRYPLAGLKALRIGGSVISSEGMERLRTHLCRNVILSYASTEAGTAAIAPYETIAHIPHAVGYVLPGVEIEIVDHAGTILSPGTEGFVRLRSPQFLKNLDGSDQSAWFYPGDLGSLTAEGVLCIAGRTGDVVNRGGTKLASADFEAFLLSCAGVKDAGICTMMGVSGQEEIWVAVALDDSIDMAMFRHRVETNEPFGTNIDRLFVVPSIPRNELGKVKQEALREMLQAIEP